MFLLLAQDAEAPMQPPPQSYSNPMQLPVLMIGSIAIFYFLMIRPQRKAEKARREKLDAVKKGDTVRTRGGIEGVVSRVQDDRVILRIDTEGKILIPFAKAYIEEVLDDKSASESK